MSVYDELLRNYSTHATQNLPPIIADAAAALGIEGTDHVEFIGLACAKAYLMGVEAGQTEMLAQAVEQGARANIRQVRAPREGS